MSFGVLWCFIYETIGYRFILPAFKMEKEIIIGAFGLIVGYFIFKLITRKQKNSTNVYSKVLMNDKYKVKGQWGLFRDKLWGKKSWSEGHFYGSVGAVTKESMEWYVTKGQKKHWQKYTYEQYCQMKNQRVISDFAS